MNLSIQNLSKTYPNGKQALLDVSLEIGTGMFGLLGPNGAGKSTLMRTLATLQEADSGAVTFGDVNVLTQKQEVKRFLGYLPQEFDFYKREKATDLLSHFALLKGVTNKKERAELVEALLRKVNLWDERKQKLGTFSGGMKQRFGIAVILLGNPKLIIVDEPTAGLDPNERNRFHNLLSELGENMIVILSTHIVEDVSDLCTKMAIINNGEIVYEDAPLQAIAKLEGKIWKKTIDKEQLDETESRFDVISTKLYAGRTIVHAYADSNPGDGFEASETSLEDVYFLQLKRAGNDHV